MEWKQKGLKKIVKLEFLTYPVHHRSRQVFDKRIPNGYIAQNQLLWR